MCAQIFVCNIYTYMEVNNGKESNNVEKIEKQSNPKWRI